MQLASVPALSRSRPRRAASSTTAVASWSRDLVERSRTSSIAASAPSPRTSPICGTSPASATCGRAGPRRSPPHAQRDLHPRSRPAREGSSLCDGLPTWSAHGGLLRCVHRFRPAEHAGERRPAAIDLATTRRSGSTLNAPSRTSGRCGRRRSPPRRKSGRSRALADPAQPAHGLRRGRDEAALALLRLENGSGELRGSDLRREQPARGRRAPSPRPARGTRSGRAR